MANPIDRLNAMLREASLTTRQHQISTGVTIRYVSWSSDNRSWVITPAVGDIVYLSVDGQKWAETDKSGKEDIREFDLTTAKVAELIGSTEKELTDEVFAVSQC